MFNLIDAATQISNEPAPLLLLDTCSLLDLIRLPLRDNLQLSNIDSCRRILQLVNQTPKGVWVISHKLIDFEWKNNIDKVYLDSERCITNFDKSYERMLEISVILGNTRTRKHVLHLINNIPLTLKNLSRALIDHSLMLDDDDICNANAGKRVVMAIPPAAKGQQFKDCMIIEHYFSLCKSLRLNGFQERIVFCSSNTKDYYDPTTDSLYQVLSDEFTNLGMAYCTNLTWACSDLGIIP